MKRVLAFNYVLKGADGQVLDTSEKNQPLPFLEGAGQIIPALEAQIKDMKEGDKKVVKLAAKDAYGLPEEKMMMDVPKEPRCQASKTCEAKSFAVPSRTSRIFLSTAVSKAPESVVNLRDTSAIGRALLTCVAVIRISIE